jgi:hypothetical protein
MCSSSFVHRDLQHMAPVDGSDVSRLPPWSVDMQGVMMATTL